MKIYQILMKGGKMVNLQKQFEKFHCTIKVDKEELKDKRDIIVDKIKDSLKKSGYPIPKLFNQGSYIYGVGIKTISDKEEYDIDIGLVFNIKSADYSAKIVRERVFDAIKDHTQNVEEKGPCIRVRYKEGFHVDIVCYSRYTESEEYENFKLAHRNGDWKDTDPEKLKGFIKRKRIPFQTSKDSSGSDQLQRVVRYLKRWNDKALLDGSEDKPVGLALLLLSIEILQKPIFNSEGKSDDLKALREITFRIKSLSRIFVTKPTPEYEDVFGKISDNGMKKLLQRFKKLDESLHNALNERDLEKACQMLRDEFGEDFPLEREEYKNISIITERPYRE